MKVITTTDVGIEFKSVNLKWNGHFYLIEFSNEDGSIKREAKASGIFSRKPTVDESDEFMRIYSKMFSEFVEKEMTDSK